MSAAAEIRLTSALGPLRLQLGALLLGDGAPCGGIIPSHTWKVGLNHLPRFVPCLVAERRVENPFKNQNPSLLNWAIWSAVRGAIDLQSGADTIIFLLLSTY